MVGHDVEPADVVDVDEAGVDPLEAACLGELSRALAVDQAVARVRAVADAPQEDIRTNHHTPHTRSPGGTCSERTRESPTDRTFVDGRYRRPRTPFSRSHQRDNQNNCPSSDHRARGPSGEMRQRRGVAPNRISYSAAIAACERGDEWERALALFEEMTRVCSGGSGGGGGGVRGDADDRGGGAPQRAAAAISDGAVAGGSGGDAGRYVDLHEVGRWVCARLSWRRHGGRKDRRCASPLELARHRRRACLSSTKE